MINLAKVLKIKIKENSNTLSIFKCQKSYLFAIYMPGVIPECFTKLKDKLVLQFDPVY